MRAAGLKTQGYKTGGGMRRFFLCLMLGALILGASSFVRRQLGIPLAFSLASDKAAVPGKNTPSPAPPVYGQCEISLPGRSWYALQLGAFTQENAAHQLSQEFIPRGAAGFVLAQDDVFRVYAAAYPTRAEAQRVQTHLNEQGVSTYIQPCSEQSLAVLATGTEKQLKCVQDIFSYLSTLSQKFFHLSAQLDSGTLSGEEALCALASESATCHALSAALDAAFDGALPDDAQPLHDLMALLMQECEAVQNSKSAARAGAALKRSQFTVIVGLANIASALH